MTAPPERSPLAERRLAAVRGAVEALRGAAATAELVALTYDAAASSATGTADGPCAPAQHGDREAWARAGAEEERCAARQRWTTAAEIETSTH